MSTPGPNATEAAKIVQRGRARVIAIIMQAIEENGEAMHPAEQERIKTVAKEQVNTFADGICAMLPTLVDESVTVNSFALEMLSEIKATLDELRDGR